MLNNESLLSSLFIFCPKIMIKSLWLWLEYWFSLTLSLILVGLDTSTQATEATSIYLSVETTDTIMSFVPSNLRFSLFGVWGTCSFTSVVASLWLLLNNETGLLWSKALLWCFLSPIPVLAQILTWDWYKLYHISKWLLMTHIINI